MQKLIIFQDKVECPVCDGQGFVRQITLQPINKIVYVCDECEAMWLDPDTISIKNFIDLTTYIESCGYTYTTVRYEDEDYYWYAKKSKGN